MEILQINGDRCRNGQLICSLCVIMLVVLISVGPTNASWRFEIQILGVRNVRGELASGACCGGERQEDGNCPGQCNTMVNVCVKHFQAVVTPDGQCIFGNGSTTILGGNSFTVNPTLANHSLLILRSDFAWQVR